MREASSPAEPAEASAKPASVRSAVSTSTGGEETTNVSICSSSNLSITQASSERDSEDWYADVGFMFEGLQASTLKRFTWGRPTLTPESATKLQQPEVRVAVHVVDEVPGAVQSGHYLWPAATALAEYLIGVTCGPESRQDDPVSPWKPRNVVELGAGSALVSLTALQLMHDSLQCIVVTDHDPGTLERARDNYETTLEDLLEATETEEEQFDCINGVNSIPVMFESLEWGDADRSMSIARAAADHSSPLLLDETAPASCASLQSGEETGRKGCAISSASSDTQPEQRNPRHNLDRNIFDLILASDVIYCKDIVEPLLRQVSYFMTPEGCFLLSQSIPHNDEIEDRIKEVCNELHLQRDLIDGPADKSESPSSSDCEGKDYKEPQHHKANAIIQRFTWPMERH